MFYCPCCTAQPHCGQTTFFGRSQCFEICCDLPYTRAMGAPIAPFRVLVEHLILQLCDEFFSACQLHWILSHFHHFLYPYTFLFSFSGIPESVMLKSLSKLVNLIIYTFNCFYYYFIYLKLWYSAC